MKIEILFAIISLILYYVAPDKYNWGFSALCSLIFILEVLITLWPDFKKKNYFSFNLIFFFSYFWTSFAYPILIYGTFRDRDNIINKVINWEYLSHTSALALVFITFYILGYKCLKDNSKPIKFHNRIRIPIIPLLIVSAIFLCVALYGKAITGLSSMSFAGYIVDIFFSLFTIVLVGNIFNNSKIIKNKTLRNFLKINKTVLLTGFVIFCGNIIIGNRGPAIKIVLLLFAAYYFYWKRITIKRLIFIGFFLLLLLFFVRVTRNKEQNLYSGEINIEMLTEAFKLENGYLYVFADLFFINRELCLGYEYSINHGLFHPERLLLVPFYPIPLLPSFISKTFWGISPSQMDTGDELNDIVLQSITGVGHLGNHPAVDLLMSFGYLGMIILSFIFGMTIKFIQKNKESSFIFACLFLTIMSWSIYMPRSYIFMLIRPLGYILIMDLIFTHTNRFNKKI